MPINLKPHNVETYKKIIEKQKTSNRVAVIHPTGTGKMYIALKMLEDNKDKKALYIAPSNSILHDVKKNIFAEGMNMLDFPNLERITYQKLMNLTDDEIEKLDVDIVILDEFHHCGAPEWGRGVERLIGRNPNANILGLSATPLRYSDGLRDMADELFDNNVASEMTLEEAIEQGILPEATYVSALYGYEAELENMQANINKIQDKEKREQGQELFNSLSKELDENTRNLPELLAEHMKNKTGKYIVFCKNIQDMQKKMEQANEMFGSVNQNITVRGVASTLKENDRVLTEFENDNDENSLKILYAVDMLNEGYHVKDLDGVIMMRPTFSPTIFTQQLGRGLTVGGDKKTVIIDLVNNFDSCKIIEDFAEIMRQYKGKEGTKTPKEKTKSRISIFDKTKKFRDIAGKIAELSKIKKISLDEKIKIFERFSKTEEELTGNTIFEGYPIGQWAIQIRNSTRRKNAGEDKKINASEEQLEKLETLGILERQIDSTIDEKIQSLVDWMAKYPKLGVVGTISEENFREYAKTEEEYKKIVEQYEKMQGYYEYIRYRKSQGKLNPEQISKCKEGNIRGVFGYPTKTEELAKKTEQTEETIDYILTNYETMDNFIEEYQNGDLYEEKDLKLAHEMFGYPTQIEELAQKTGRSKEEIDYIIINYETMDNFIKAYMNGELDAEDLRIAQTMIRKAINIENPNDHEYDELAKAIWGYRDKILLYSREKLKEALETLADKQKYAIKRRFKLLGVNLPTDLESIRQDMGVKHKQSVSQYIKDALKKLCKPSIMKKFAFKIETSPMFTDEENKLIEELEEKTYSSDVIYSSDSCKVSPDDEKSKDIFKAYELIKNRDKIIKERKEQQEREITQKQNTLIEDTNIPEKAYRILKSMGINTMIDMDVFLNEQDNYLLMKELGKEEWIQLIREKEKYCCDGYDQDTWEKLNKMSQEDFEKDIEGELEKKIEESTINDEDIFRIENMNFSVRTFNCLKKAGIDTIEDLQKRTPEELIKIRNLGKKCLNEIINKLSENSVTLRQRQYERKVNEYIKVRRKEIESKRKEIEPRRKEIPIEDLNFSTRAYNCLWRAGIDNIADLQERTKADLKKIRNLGNAAFLEIVNKLSEYGITLRENDDDELEEDNSNITGQDIGKASYDASIEECDKAEAVLTQNIKDQQLIDGGGIENNDSN